MQKVEGSVFDAEQFGVTLASGFFFAYAEMVLQLHGLAEDIMSWTEGCACHEPVFKGRSESQRHSAMRSDAGDACSKGCCMQGLRAPDLACGDAVDTFVNLQASRAEVLQSQSQHNMQPQEWGVVMRDFEMGAQCLKLGLTVKLSNWGKLPWKLAGLAHHFTHKAQEAARACLHLWDSTPDLSNDHHHPLTQYWLVSQREHVQFLADGGSRKQIPEHLQQEVACFSILAM